MAEPAFFSIQREFTRYLRDPDNNPAPPMLADDRLTVYSNAVIANMEVFMGDNFPLVKAVMANEDWLAMVRDYFLRHESKTSLFVELPGEFLKYLEVLRDDADDPSFLYELAHFELLENLVSTDERRIDEQLLDIQGDFMTAVPVMNPTTQLVRYMFPVHLIDRDNQPSEPPSEPTFIVAFRDRANRYGYIDLNPASARAVELLLSNEEQNGEQVMQTIARELKHPDVDAVVAGGHAILSRLAERDVVVGTKKLALSHNVGTQRSGVDLIG